MNAARRTAARLTHEPAYVLHRHDWSESSLIIDLFTRGLGRVAVVAKGAKRPYSQLRAVLLPFQRVSISLSGDAEVRLLRVAEWGGGAPGLAPDALMVGFYVNELLIRLLAREDAHPALFDLYDHVVQALASRDAPERDLRSQAVLRAFELGLLQELGLLPALDRITLTQQALGSQAGYALDPEHGLVASERPDALRGRLLLELATALACVQADQRLQRLQSACATALPILRGQLRAVLHYHLGTPLRTRALMQELATP